MLVTGIFTENHVKHISISKRLHVTRTRHFRLVVFALINAMLAGCAIDSSHFKRNTLDYALDYYFGRGVEKDVAKAAQLFEVAAAEGNLRARGKLGHMYLDGEGVTQDLEKAYKYLHESATGGVADGQNMLGIMYADQLRTAFTRLLLPGRPWHRT